MVWICVVHHFSTEALFWCTRLNNVLDRREEAEEAMKMFVNVICLYQARDPLGGFLLAVYILKTGMTVSKNFLQ